MSDVIAFDSEVFYSPKLKYTLRTQIAEQFCRSHLFECYMVSACDGTTSWAGHPSEFNWQSLEGKTIISHNAYWDRTCYEELVRRELAPRINFKAWHCSANLTAFICNRRALDDAVEYLFKVKLDKSARADAANKHWPADFSEIDRAKMLTYARGDALWCWKLWDKFSLQWPEHEQRLSNLMIEQGQKGVQIDRELLNNYILWSHEMKLNTEKLLPWMRDEGDEDSESESTAKPTSTKAISEQCRRVGIPCPPVKAHEGEEAFQEWEALYGPKHDWIPALSSWRSVNKLYKTFCVVKERLRDDGTLPFGQKYMGTHTGRVAGESRVNLFNQRKQAVLCNEKGLMETNDARVDSAHKEKKALGVWPAWVRYGIDFRNMIVARPGLRLIASDSSQIEPRVAAWFAKDTEFLELVANGFSPYHAHAITTMGWKGGNLKVEDDKLYGLAKARLLSLSYGAGWEKLIIMARTVAGLDLTLDDPEWIEVAEGKKISGYGSNAKKVVSDYRASNLKITALWKKLDDALRSSIREDFIVTLPSGRNLRYESVRAETRLEPDKETGLPRRRTVFTACIGGKRVITYGSKIFENICQACARDVFYWQVLKLADAGFDMLLGVYDEFVTECALDRDIKEVKSIMSKTPPWLSGCPVTAEAHEIACYQK